MSHPKKVLPNQAFIKILGTLTLFLILTPFFKSSAQVKTLEKITPTYFSASPSTLPNISSTPISPTPFPEEPEEFPFSATLPRFEIIWPSPQPEFSPLEYLSSFFKYRRPPFLLLIFLFIDFIAYALILSISYLILKKANLIKSRQFLKYIFFLTIGGGLIKLVIGILIDYLSLIFSCEQDEIWAMILVGIPFLSPIFLIGFYNYWLSRRTFNLDKKQTIFISVIIGIFSFFMAIIKVEIAPFRYICSCCS